MKLHATFNLLSLLYNADVNLRSSLCGDDWRDVHFYKNGLSSITEVVLQLLNDGYSAKFLHPSMYRSIASLIVRCLTYIIPSGIAVVLVALSS